MVEAADGKNEFYPKYFLICEFTLHIAKIVSTIQFFTYPEQHFISYFVSVLKASSPLLHPTRHEAHCFSRSLATDDMNGLVSLLL